MSTKELGDFLQEQCRHRGLSLRSLSIKCGLSQGTVHSIVKREYQPTLYSLNRLADYLDVRREYLWQLAGLLEDMEYTAETMIGDPRLRFLLAQVDKLPEPAMNLIIRIIATIVAYLGTDTRDA